MLYYRLSRAVPDVKDRGHVVPGRDNSAIRPPSRRPRRLDGCGRALSSRDVVVATRCRGGRRVRAPGHKPPGVPFGRELAFVAGRGERNATVVQAAYAGTPWTVRDTGAVIIPGEGCTAHDAHTVSCAAPPTNMFDVLIAADVSLGDLDDRVTLEQPDQAGFFKLFAAGGDGNDTLSSQGGGALNGGAGDDILSSRSSRGSSETTLDGGGGRDELRGGDGPETFD
jgi:hypothetical protein